MKHASLYDLHAWTGYEHAYLVQSGSAALRLLLATMLQPGARVALPAVCCWTIAGTISSAGMRLNYLDVDERLRPVKRDDGENCAAAVAVDPWGICNDFSLPANNCSIVDLTLNLFGAGSRRAAATRYDAAYISLGRGKACDIGAGGVILVNEQGLARQIESHLSYGRAGQRWGLHTERYVFPELLTEVVAQKLAALKVALPAHVMRRIEWERWASRCDLPIAPIGINERDEPGFSRLVPHLLEHQFPLSAIEIHCAALAQGVPLGIVPVSPPYLEPALFDAAVRCPAAEELSSRLLFVPEDQLCATTAETLSRFLHALSSRPDSFKRPYRITDECQPLLPADQWLAERGLVCRALDGHFQAFDVATGKRYSLNPGQARWIEQTGRVNGVPNPH
jgi:dTDP-4-amino-4,6-dideoxygalactose transaminase